MIYFYTIQVFQLLTVRGIIVSNVLVGAKWSFPGMNTGANNLFYTEGRYYYEITAICDNGSDPLPANADIIASTTSSALMIRRSKKIGGKDPNKLTAIFEVAVSGVDATATLDFSVKGITETGSLKINAMQVGAVPLALSQMSFSSTFVIDTAVPPTAYTSLFIQPRMSRTALMPNTIVLLQLYGAPSIDVRITEDKDNGTEFVPTGLNFYQVKTDALGVLTLRVYPKHGLVGDLGAYLCLGVAEKRAENDVFFICADLQEELQAPDILELHGDTLIPPPTADSQFSVNVPTYNLYQANDRVVIIATSLDDDDNPQKITVLDDQLLPSDPDRVLGHYGFKVDYSALSEEGDHLLSYYSIRQSGTGRASAPFFFKLKSVDPNKPDPFIDTKRTLGAPEVYDADGSPIPNDMRVYVNERRIGTTGLTIVFTLPQDTGLIGRELKATVYLNGERDGSWQALKFAKVFAGKDSITLTSAMVNGAGVNAAIPLDALRDFRSRDDIGKQGSIYVECYLDDKSKYSQFWGASLDTVAPGG